MIHHFTQADEDYGRRVKEAIQQKQKELEEMHHEETLPGRVAGASKYGQGTLLANEATKEAVEKGNEAEPY